ncbi:MAG: hypothetical protein U0L88_00365 [Acutalibacteraceae bacterium]|nr:hypothetical protein [Acutalibacteraceae bacterium]
MFEQMANYNMNALARNAVEIQKLASNFIDIISDCESLEDFDLRNALQDRYPLAVWLLGNRFSSVLRDMESDPQRFHKDGEDSAQWVMDVPGTVYTLEPSNSGDDCCWTIPDFAKCAGSVPMAFVCLKDCDNIFDSLVYDKLRINAKAALERFAREGETIAQVENRIRHLWMAFYTMHTMILGTMATSDNITKPFHGLLEILQNDAVISISGANILAAFDSIACRLAVLGGEDWVFAVNPLIYRSIKAVIKRDERGEYPEGWEVVNGRLRFEGIGFIDDKLVPVDMKAMTGDVWLIDGSATGAYLAYDLGNEAERDTFTEQSKANGCGQECHFLYNFGTVANNNANRVMVISGVPVSSACTEIADLAALINPTTLVPAA